MKKRICALVLAAAVLLAALAAFAEEDDADQFYTLYVICKPDSYVNVREFPKKNALQAGRVECGDEVETKGEKRGQYLKVYISGIEAGEGWIHRGYLVEEVPEVYRDGIPGEIRAKGRVAVRRFVDGPRRVWISPGKQVKIYALSDEWALTNRGFIRREFIEIWEEEARDAA